MEAAGSGSLQRTPLPKAVEVWAVAAATMVAVEASAAFCKGLEGAELPPLLDLTALRAAETARLQDLRKARKDTQHVFSRP